MILVKRLPLTKFEKKMSFLSLLILRPGLVMTDKGLESSSGFEIKGSSALVTEAVEDGLVLICAGLNFYLCRHTVFKLCCSFLAGKCEKDGEHSKSPLLL